MQKRIAIQQDARVRVRTYTLFSECVESGVKYGLMRHEKYATDETSLTPEQVESLTEKIELGVMNAIAEYFEFGPEEPA